MGFVRGDKVNENELMKKVLKCIGKDNIIKLYNREKVEITDKMKRDVYKIVAIHFMVRRKVNIPKPEQIYNAVVELYPELKDEIDKDKFISMLEEGVKDKNKVNVIFRMFLRESKKDDGGEKDA